MQALAATCAALAAIGGMLIAVYAKCIRPFQTFARDLRSLVRDHPAMREAVQTIRSEVSYNGGGSLKDSVRRVETRQLSGEAWFRARIETASDISFYTDSKGEFTSVTGGFTKLTGLGTPQCQHGKWRVSIHPDYVDSTTAAWNEAISNGAVFVHDVQFRDVIHGGSVPTRVTATPVVVNNTITGWAGTIELLEPTKYEPDPVAVQAVADHFARKNLP